MERQLVVFFNGVVINLINQSQPYLPSAMLAIRYTLLYYVVLSWIVVKLCQK